MRLDLTTACIHLLGIRIVGWRTECIRRGSRGPAATYEKFAEGGRRPRKGPPLTVDFLGRVADVYRQALEEGDHPTRTVADTWSVHRGAASRWVKAARGRGLLGPAKAGRASA